MQLFMKVMAVSVALFVPLTGCTNQLGLEEEIFIEDPIPPDSVYEGELFSLSILDPAVGHIEILPRPEVESMSFASNGEGYCYIEFVDGAGECLRIHPDVLSFVPGTVYEFYLSEVTEGDPGQFSYYVNPTVVYGIEVTFYNSESQETLAVSYYEYNYSMSSW